MMVSLFIDLSPRAAFAAKAKRPKVLFKIKNPIPKKSHGNL